ncbi:MAG: sulfurase, partial [Luteolibacter sp.]
GFYLRVVEEGSIAAGTAVETVSHDPRQVTVRDLLGMFQLGEGTSDRIKQALEIDALSPIVRKALKARLEKM